MKLVAASCCLLLLFACSGSPETTEVRTADDVAGTTPRSVLLIEPYRAMDFTLMDEDGDQDPEASLSLRGQQVLSNLRSDPQSETVQLIRIHESLFTKDVVGSFDLPGLKSYPVTSLEWSSSDTGFTWSASIEDSLGGEAILVVEDGDVTGTLWIDGELYRVRALDEGAHALIKVNQGALPPDHPPGAESRRLIPFRNVQPEDDTETCRQESPPTSSAEIRVLVASTPKVRKKLESTGSSVSALTKVAMRETNRGFERSGIRAVVRLAELVEVDYDENGSYESHVDRFASARDGAMDEIHALRDERRADVCILLVMDDGACGWAKENDARAHQAFATVTESCATGYYSFGHEIGHLLAAEHEEEPGSFMNGHGFHDTEKRFRTIMASKVGYTRRLNWSNPNIDLMGRPTGTEDEHFNVCVLNRRAPVAAMFR